MLDAGQLPQLTTALVQDFEGGGGGGRGAAALTLNGAGISPNAYQALRNAQPGTGRGIQ